MTTKPSSRGGTDVAIPKTLFARVIAGARYAVTGKGGDWFGPGTPAEAVAPESVAGRQTNYPVMVNATTSTKTVGLAFEQLRSVADACDVIRTLIETRKDQMCGFGWVIKPIEDDGAASEPSDDPRVAKLTAFFKSPDKQHTWSEWLRMILEDLFVLDAPAIYVQQDFGGNLFALHPVDGATIKRLIDPRGWVPVAPDPAFQQILRGMPAINYTTDELIYKPRNPRTHRIYGYSPVEQVIVTAQLLLSRQASNLEFYQSGNLPEGFLQGGDGWTPEQIGEYQEAMDTLLSGNFAERRKARVVPFRSQYQAVKEPALKSDFDEWLTRIACFAFSYPPSSFVKQMNRATSESAKESADEEGVNPLRHWVKELIDSIIQQRFGFDDLEFAFEDKEAQDPMERAQIDAIYLAAGVLHPDEVRSDLGKEPMSEDMKNDVKPPAPVIVAPGADPNAPPTGAKPGDPPAPAKDEKKKPIAKRRRKGRPAKPFSRKTPAITKARDALTGALTAALSLAAEQAGQQLVGALGKAAGDAELSARVDKALAELTLDGLAEVDDEMLATLQGMATTGAEAGLNQLTIGADSDAIVSLSNDRAIAWADKRAGELIKSDAGGGELLDATRALIRGTVEDAVSEGWSPQRLTKELAESYAFSADRAETIARTEVAMALNAGSMEGYRASGVVTNKVWLVAEEPCAICMDNEAEGEIPLDDDFSSGDDTAPAHPRCECDVAPIVYDEAGDAEADGGE